MPNNAKIIIKAISKLANKRENNKNISINAHSIATETGLDWRTVKRYLKNNLNIKEIN